MLLLAPDYSFSEPGSGYNEKQRGSLAQNMSIINYLGSMLTFTSSLKILLSMITVLFKFIPSLNIWSVDISSGLLECRRCHLNCRTNESRMQFFRCALLWETLKLSCWRECSMKDDPSHFSHDIEPACSCKKD